ncbi:polymeric immunoglobulin receptor-like [Hypanus sabinus]|uniref:polymeric immunoglobulin receptor-like n=1 Tax=Hypanus sabinus TaxID=79690 RepID=UPI0028C4689E|nr:polymeric immunoglobulin receptor-like [Hypanus sabinus]XP_059806137.1 polymeric immunoglobulin receptor-like [Hypanus sabinus]XP_059806138.1 polymeric immunoglobulin receptor-like [Hypanus sabinus]
MPWTLILLIGFLPVSGALWAVKYIGGYVGRAITIDCHYEAQYRSDTKYWCHGWTLQCSVLVKTKGQHGRRGRVSITDNPERGIFTVTMEDLHSGDAGWYSCGISTPGFDPLFNVQLKVSDELMSAPVVRYLSPANVSRLGGSVSLSCESFQGSLPIQYRWYEQTSSGYPTISDTNELTLHCQSFNHTHHQYYCSASNRFGARSSAMFNVTVFNNGKICSYVTEINDTISGALWTEDKVRGVVGSTITIDCHYAPLYRSHKKYLCRMGDRQCTLLVNTNGTNKQNGRMRIRDNTSQGIFTVTMENLVSNDTGHYRCGISTSGQHPVFDVHLQVSAGSKHVHVNTKTGSITTAQKPTYIIVLTVTGILLILLVICLLCYLRRKNRESNHNTSHRGGNNETQEMAMLEENIVYADIHHARNNEAAAQSADNENGTVYANMKFKRKSRAGRSVMYEDNPTYADIKFQSQSTRPKYKAFSPGTP